MPAKLAVILLVFSAALHLVNFGLLAPFAGLKFEDLDL